MPENELGWFSKLKMMIKSIQKWVRELVKATDHLIDTRFSILKRAIQTFYALRAPHAAAGIAYYAIFSLFPLILVIIAVGSYFVDPDEVFGLVTGLVSEYIPTAMQLINANLSQMFHAREAFGAVALLTLLWAASSVFTSLAYNINLAWTDARRRNFLHKRLVGLAMTVAISLMLVLFLGVNWVMGLEIVLNAIKGSPLIKSLWGQFSTVASWFTIFLLLFTLYRLSPGSRSRWKAIFWGALVATIAWKATTAVFSWYLVILVDSYRLIYGSLGAIVAFLLLVYILAFITLFGAHLAAAIDRSWRQQLKDRIKD